jgi:hypothetical protein
MKYKVTQKEMKDRFRTLIAVRYCALQNLLYFEEPVAYGERPEGWACDYYVFEDSCISTGYAPIGRWADGDLVKHYDLLARTVLDADNLTYENRQRLIKALLVRFISEFKAYCRKPKRKKKRSGTNG